MRKIPKKVGTMRSTIRIVWLPWAKRHGSAQEDIIVIKTKNIMII